MCGVTTSEVAACRGAKIQKAPVAPANVTVSGTSGERGLSLPKAVSPYKVCFNPPYRGMTPRHQTITKAAGVQLCEDSRDPCGARINVFVSLSLRLTQLQG